MSNINKCIEGFNNRSSCSQAILSIFGPYFGLNEKLAHKLGSGLGAGFGRKQYLCGAVSAGALILSLKYGNEVSKDYILKEKTYTRVRDFINWFEKEMGTSSCKELLGLQILSEEGKKKGLELNLFNTVCKDCIKKVAEYLEKEVIDNPTC